MINTEPTTAHSSNPEHMSRSEPSQSQSPTWHYLLAISSAITMLFHAWIVMQITFNSPIDFGNLSFSGRALFLWFPSPIGLLIGLLLIDRKPRWSAMLVGLAALEMLTFAAFSSWLIRPATFVYLATFVQYAILANVTALKSG